ncbi:hypothetical protein HLP28_003595 [Shigella sonnei]|nr:hypothetical protein [Escherichia coli]EFP9185903.1 hypothetical protein [Shigella sonnei]EFI8736731.1 hypothetical protein [Escherichia coli]EFP9190138.1 hypothetical protein [Shigella sonnei]EFP9210755.1 hypothetical protein [Shigella sonnei]
MRCEVMIDSDANKCSIQMRLCNMILCVLLNYHISCPFPAAQIRFPAEVDTDLICC